VQVVATAGHVDHGKSTLVRALTGMEPDRWEEERRRGLTIDLGFCWTSLPGVGDVAFVDVPGHERFVPNMLVGVGSVPAVLFVVAADAGWMPQSEEHLRALAALDVRHGVLAVTRADLADPGPTMRDAQERLGRTPFGDVPAVAVSGLTGEGLDGLRRALTDLIRGLPVPSPDADVRLWIDRCFTVRGAGTVVTGTLVAGTIRAGDHLQLARDGREVAVRGMQLLGRPVTSAAGVARVALNLRGAERTDVRRGDALLTPHAWRSTAVFDARLVSRARSVPPERLILHVGSAAVGARVRSLGADAARLLLDAPLALRVGDRALLRDPGAHEIVAGVVVLDVAPPTLRRRGEAARRGRALQAFSGRPEPAAEVTRRGVVRGADLRAWGHGAPPGAPLVADWYTDPDQVVAWRSRLAAAVMRHRAAHPLESGPTIEALRRDLDLPDVRIVEALVEPPYALREGRVVPPTAGELPASVAAAVAELTADLSRRPFSAPEASRLAELGLGPRELAAAARAGLLLRVSDSLVLSPNADRVAADRLAQLPQPFTVAEARSLLDTTRRVAVPLLELLDRQGLTRRLPDDRRVCRPAGAPTS
jgi:selenocysteine-specific elongation factor